MASFFAWPGLDELQIEPVPGSLEKHGYSFTFIEALTTVRQAYWLKINNAVCVGL